MSLRPRSSILVVEDEQDLREMLVECLEAEGFAVAAAPTAADAVDRLRGFAYDGLVVDLRLPDANGLTVLDEAVARFPQIAAVAMTGWGGVTEAVDAIKRGAIDFLIKPFELSQLTRILKAVLEERRLREENAELRAELHDRYRFDQIVGQSAAMRQVFATLELVAPRNNTVMVEGETGTGKELVARAVHHNSPRRDQPFVAFNAAAIPDGLAEAELFGHVRGAFTGAVQARTGRFELANRGTLFIDEVSSMSLPLQAKLLRVIQERRLERVGDSRSVPFDVRIVAATNVDLKTLVRERAFREDLYYRLNVIRVKLPALRERTDDIPILAQHFLKKTCKSNGLPPRVLGQQVIRVLMGYSWPGNIRQLENAIEYAVAMSGDSLEIVSSMLPEEILQADEAHTLAPVTIPDEGLNFVSVVSQLERDLILKCLEKTGGNKRQAARLLQLSRTTLIDKLQRLSVSSPQEASA